MLIFKSKLQYLTIIFIHLSCLCFSQKGKYNFSFQDVGLDAVIKELSNQSKVNILYNPNILPNNVKINGNFKNLTLKQALDTFLNQTQILYKFYKKDIVLYRKNEEIKETHQIYKPDPQKKNGTDKIRETITDTVTYAVVTHDTVVTILNDYVKVPVMDTIKVYETIQVVKKVIRPVNEYKPKQESLIAGLSFSEGMFFSNIHMEDPKKDSSGIINASIHEKQGNGLGINLIYRNKKIMIETGVSLSKTKYTFNYTHPTIGFITVLDTIDKYYTGIAGEDTTWVYITEEKQVKQVTEKIYYSDLVYQYISVPILFGYNLTKKNFTFEFKGGVLCNFYIGSKGSYLNISPNNEITVEDSKAPNSFALLGAFGALGIDYYLNKQFHIFTQPSISWTALPLGKKNAAYYTTDLQIGIHVGIRYYF